MKQQTGPKLPPTPHPLARCLGVVGILFLTLSATTPASSVFIIVPGMLQSAGTGTLWAFLLAALVCVATAYVYAELSSAFPVAGGNMSRSRARSGRCRASSCSASMCSTT